MQRKGVRGLELRHVEMRQVNISKVKLIPSMAEVQDLAAPCSEALSLSCQSKWRIARITTYEAPTSLVIFDMNFDLCSVPPDFAAC